MTSEKQCRYCDSSVRTDEELLEHLSNAHETDELSRVDERRVKQYSAEKPSRFTRRTALLGSVAGLGTVVGLGSVGVTALGGSLTGTTDPEKDQQIEAQSISLSNSVYTVSFGEEASFSWSFLGTSLLSSETYMLRSGGQTVSAETDGTVTSPYPNSGQPGTTYSATIEFTFAGTTVEIRRLVTLDTTDALLTVTYEIENTGGSSLSNLQFYEYIDYDIDGPGDDTAQYVSSPIEYIYQEDGGVYTAYTSAVQSDAHDVDRFNDVESRIVGGNSLQNLDSDSGDVESALRLDISTLNPGEQTNRTVGFVAGNSQQAVEDLLKNIRPIPPSVRVEGDNATFTNTTVSSDN